MRAIDADTLVEILTTAIRNMQGVAKFIGAEDDPEIKMEIKAYTDILEGVKEQPTIEPEQKKGRWIPCSEKLPEDEQIVLVTYKTTDRLHMCQYHEDGSRNQWYSFNDMCRAHNNVVAAWMPLPEPYKGGGQNGSD